MVWSLELIKDIEDKNLFAGHLAMFVKEFDKAQVIKKLNITYVVWIIIKIIDLEIIFGIVKPNTSIRNETRFIAMGCCFRSC